MEGLADKDAKIELDIGGDTQVLLSKDSIWIGGAISLPILQFYYIVQEHQKHFGTRIEAEVYFHPARGIIGTPE